MPLKSLSPLQGPPAPTTQIPICVAVLLLLPLAPLLLPEVVEPEDVCAFIIIVNTENESRLIPIIKNINMLHANTSKSFFRLISFVL